MNLYIELETYNREFESRMLLALEAVSRDYNVVIAHRDIIQKFALENILPPGIIHMKDANSGSYQIEKLKKLRKKNFFLTAQDEESGMLNEKFEQFAKLRFNNFKSFKYLNYFFCWGPRDFNYLKKKYKISKLTGSPRYDLYINKKKKIKKKRILVVSSFNSTGIRPFADRIFANIGFRGNSFADQFTEKTTYSLESIHVHKVYHFVKLVRFLSEEFKNYEIVLRPHPADNPEVWQKLINRKYKNFKVDFSDSLRDSILNSDFVIQNGCTSAIESLLLKRRCISYVPKEWKEDTYAKFPNSLGIKAKNFKNIKTILNSKINKEQYHKFRNLKKRLFYSKNFNSYEKQINLFDKLIFKTKKFEPDMTLSLKFQLAKTKNKLKRKIFRNRITVLDRKFPAFDKFKIKNLIADIAAKTRKEHFLNTKVSILSERAIFLKKN